MSTRIEPLDVLWLQSQLNSLDSEPLTVAIEGQSLRVKGEGVVEEWRVEL